MNYIESLKYVKENDSAVFAVNVKNKELITIIYDPNPENFSDIIVFYSQEIDSDSGVDELYTPEEFDLILKDTMVEYDFIACKKEIDELHGDTFESILKDMNDYKLSE